MDDPSFDWVGALKRIETEAALVQQCVELNVGPTASTIALTASSESKAKVQPSIVCSNCKRPHHTIDFCIKPGGRMVGRTLDEAKAAQRAAAGKPPRPAQNSQSANVVTGTTPTVTDPAPTTPTGSTSGIHTASGGTPVTSPPIVMNRVTYYPAPTPTLPITPQTANVTTHVGSFCGNNDLLDFRTFVAVNEDPIVSLDWASHSKPVQSKEVHAYMGVPPSRPFPAAHLEESPFVLDTGATCHISPECSDFQSFTPIQPHPIKGLGGGHVFMLSGSGLSN